MAGVKSKRPGKAKRKVASPVVSQEDYQQRINAMPAPYKWPLLKGRVPDGWIGSNLKDGNYRQTPAKGYLRRIGDFLRPAPGLAFIGSAPALSTAAAAKKEVNRNHNSLKQYTDWIPHFDLTSGVANGLGTLTAVRDANNARKKYIDQSNDSDSKKLAFIEGAGSSAGVARSAATSVYNFSDYFNTTTSASAVSNIAAGASIAIGAADMAGGIYGAHVASKRKKGILDVKNDITRLRDADPDIEEGDPYKDHLRAADIGMASQGREQVTSGGKILKGAAGIAGGALIIAGFATAGMGLVIGASLIGIAATIVNAVKKRKHKKEIVIDILGVKARREAWKAEKKRIEKNTWWGFNAREQGMKEIGEDPLNIALANSGYKDIGICYDNYIKEVSDHLYSFGIINNNVPTLNLIKNLGFNISPEKRRYITPKKIAAKLSV
ncbi:hypothetical protein [Mucilaginibacter phyllosphaerae]|uniref:Uncharacterized protein n=1 Tax=Mucilaginibacter phyllosphaerae TaxID=1812349 RepID=A0A4Y8ADJ9_9SPHI|nr:hypothetical protein [Mucilaginibacter phyllosphaerae]MBB3969175.1 hypothetical protein [Mucilaginibacter phyllosphaerae]TEW66018.1 hypothetical protein E2R65_12900 [Mucilaginibacter phyllosphaerae]